MKVTIEASPHESPAYYLALQASSEKQVKVKDIEDALVALVRATMDLVDELKKDEKGASEQ
jgi:hypothetical protein